MYFARGLFGVMLFPVLMIIPILISYFVIKLAIKNAVKELKNENIL